MWVDINYWGNHHLFRYFICLYLFQTFMVHFDPFLSPLSPTSFYFSFSLEDLMPCVFRSFVLLCCFFFFFKLFNRLVHLLKSVINCWLLVSLFVHSLFSSLASYFARIFFIFKNSWRCSSQSHPFLLCPFAFWDFRKF